MLAIAIFALSGLAAEAPLPELIGRVSNLNDLSLPGVTVSAISVEGKIGRRATLTDSTGEYRFRSLPAGPYQLSFELPAFDSREGEVIVEPGKAVRYDMVLVESPRADFMVCNCEPFVETDPPRIAQRPIEWRVRVVDTGNQRMPDAVIEIGPLGERVTSGSDGAACFWFAYNQIPTIKVTAWPFRTVDADLCCRGNNGTVVVGAEYGP